MTMYALKCKSLENFNTAVKHDRHCLVCLNPFDGLVGGKTAPAPFGEEAYENSNTEKEKTDITQSMYLLQGSSIIKCIATFEAFLHEILREAFDEVLTTSSGNIVSGFRDKTIDKLTSPRLDRIFSCMKKLFYDDKENDWPDRLPQMLFRNKEGFKIKLQIPDKNSMDIFPTSKFTKAYYTIEDYATVSNLMDLFYGVRCICAHGNPAATMTGRGCLAKFDAGTIDTLKIKFLEIAPTKYPETKSTVSDDGGVRVKRYFSDILTELQKPRTDGANLAMNYHLYLNINNFITRLALNLTTTIACLAFELQPKTKTGSFWQTTSAVWEQHVSNVF